MPRLSFKADAHCRACGHQFAVTLTAAEARVWRFVCPKCGATGDDESTARTRAAVARFVDDALADDPETPPEHPADALVRRFLDDNPIYREKAAVAPDGGIAMNTEATIAWTDWLIRNRLADPAKARALKRELGRRLWQRRADANDRPTPPEGPT